MVLIQEYIYEVPAECPYGLDELAVYRQAPCPPLAGELLDRLLAGGYRRNGNTVYTMACPTCHGCVPIRLAVVDFRPNRNQRRVWAKNRDLLIEHGPLKLNEERLALCERFLAARYPERDPERVLRRLAAAADQPFARAVDYYGGFFLNSITETYEITYRLDSGLLGLAVVDLAPNSLNAVYFFFDPDQSWRSPGTMNILYLVELARRLRLDYVYLGYWIEGVPAMSYKSRFKPHQLLLQGSWQTF